MIEEDICKPTRADKLDLPANLEPVSQGNGEHLLARPGLADWLVVGLYVLCGLIFVLAPVLAFSWQSQAFPGFVVEQTLVVSDYGGYGWSGRQAGISYPQQVVYLKDRAVASLEQFQLILSSLSVGDQVEVRTISPGGGQHLFPAIRLVRFPLVDLLRLFWLPYAIGLAYLVLGVWVYRARGMVNSGRAFAFFCASAALANALLFDLITTHVAPAIWTLAMALQGGALVSLAFYFPEEHGLFEHRNWARYIPLLISLSLAAWGLAVLYDTHQPWSYIQAWRFNYYYTALGIVFFLGMLLYRLRSEPSQLVKQQIKVILWGGLVAFIPIGIWLVAPLIGLLIPWNPLLFLPVLLVFPFSVGIAIARYRLWDLDLLINRTLVYTTLTLLLGAVYLGSVVVLQQLFISLTGQRSPLALAASTLAIALLFNPARKRVQDEIDRRFFRRKYDFAQAVESFSEALRGEVVLDRLEEKLVGLIRDTLHPSHVALCSCVGADPEAEMPIPPDDPLMREFIHAREAIDLSRLNIRSAGVKTLQERDIVLVMPLVSQGEVVGLLNIGPNQANRPYSIDDRHLLSVLTSRAAPALRVVQLVQQRRRRALEDQRLSEEMRVARLIQQTLLPHQMPDLPGWSVAGHYQPAREVGGDFFDFFNLEGGRLGLVIGDATGKGIPAALVMAAARGYIRSAALTENSPGRVLYKANEFLCAGMPPGMFVTCLYAVLDPADGSIVFANAGHNLPCHLLPGDVNEMVARGMPLGLMAGMEYEEGQATIEQGESVLFYSDGLVEAHSASGEMYGVPRLKSHVCGSPGDASLIGSLLEEWQDFRGDSLSQEDDTTLMLLHRAAANEALNNQDNQLTVSFHTEQEWVGIR